MVKRKLLRRVEDFQLMQRIKDNKGELKPCTAFTESVKRLHLKKEKDRKLPYNDKTLKKGDQQKL